MSSSSGEEPAECVGEGGPKLEMGTNWRGDVPAGIAGIGVAVAALYVMGPPPLGLGLGGGIGGTKLKDGLRFV
jgi:hypothetical protein